MEKKRRKTILLVEDDQVTAIAESRMLEKNGYAVITASTGEEAVEIALGSDGIDIILMDIDLGPGIDGTRAGERILLKRNIPILFLSSHTEPGIVEKTEKITSFGYVVKNSGETVLLASIKMAFRLHEAYLLDEIKSSELESKNIKLNATNDELNATNEELEATNEELQATMEQLISTNEELEKLLVEHKNALDRLRENEYFLNRSQKIGKVCSFVLETPEPDVKTHWWRSSPAFDEIAGIDETYPRDALSVLKLIVEPDQMMQYIREQIFEKKGMFDLEYQLRRLSDGEVRWIHGLAEPIINEEGRVIRMIGTGQDITEQKRAIESLMQSEERYRAIFENTATANIIIAEDTTVLLANTNFARVMGYSREEIERRMSWTAFVCDEDIARMKSYHYKRREGDDTVPRYYEFTGKTRTGNNPYFYTSVSMIPGTTESIASLIDITSLKQAENAIRQSEERFRDLVMLLPETVFETDAGGRVQFVNQASFEQFGYSMDDVDRGLNIIEIVTPEDRKIAIANIEKIKRGEMSTLNEYTARRKDGSTFPVLVRTAAVHHNGRIAGLRGFLIDITDRKASERALEKMAEERHSLLKELQHRIKNNLSMIMHIIDLEAGSSKSSEVKAVLEGIKWRINSLAALYGLMFKSEIVNEVELGEYLKQIVGSLADIYQKERGAIRIEEQYSSMNVNTRDATAWGLIVNELLTNALKYAFPGNQAGMIKISLQTNDGETVFSVSDNGPGPSPDFDLKSSAGFGLLMIETLTGQLGGEFTFTRGSENVFSVRIPGR